MILGSRYAGSGHPLQQSGQLRDAEDFGRRYLEWYDPRRNLTRLRALAPGITPNGQPTSALDALDMLEILLETYQAQFTISRFNQWTLMFPNLFVTPREGDQIYNKTTEETYTIEHLGVDPRYGTWDHWVRLTGETAPARDDFLMFQSEEQNLVRFVLGFPLQEARRIKSAGGELGDQHADDFIPTVTARVIRREPASLGKEPFAPGGRELKPRLFEEFRDPVDRKRYSIEIWQQRFDTLMQFDCWDRDPAVALRLADWFERFMKSASMTLVYNGVQQVLFWDQRDTLATERWREDIVAQTVRIAFRTQEIDAVRKRNLTNIIFELNVGHDPYQVGGGPTGEQETWYGRTHSASGEYLYGAFRIADLGNTGEADTFDLHNPFAGADDQLNDYMRS